MSRQLISRNPSLQRLLDEGYEIEVRSNLLLVHSVPYANARREVALGTLVSELTMVSPGLLDRPGTHQIHFIGEHPCKSDGSDLVQIRNQSTEFKLADNITAHHYFSHKPRSGAYLDYYEKVVTYARVISDQAKVIDATADAKTFKVIEPIEEGSIFQYEDTASSRAGIQRITSRLKAQRIAIVGLGGTGAYVLDLVSKTPVLEIHLYDADFFRPHNAFRSPGAASRAQLDLRLTKVAHLAGIYSAMHRGIVRHEVMVSEVNVDELARYDYIFLCVDKGTVRQLVLEHLAATAVCVIDSGMGINMTEDQEHVWGTCRVTTSTQHTREEALKRIPKVDRDEEIYGSNIQIADLNCFNASLAVVKWKRMSGFYVDDRKEYDTTFSINLNQLSRGELEQ